MFWMAVSRGLRRMLLMLLHSKRVAWGFRIRITSMSASIESL